MNFWYGGFDTGFGAVGAIIFAVAFVTIIVNGVSTWNKNRNSPRLTVIANIVAKRTHVSRHSNPNAGDPTGAHGYSTHISTMYYVTFQVESGDRMEFLVTGSEYGKLAERDMGKLTFQGTKYLDFERVS